VTTKLQQLANHFGNHARSLDGNCWRESRSVWSRLVLCAAVLVLDGCSDVSRTPESNLPSGWSRDTGIASNNLRVKRRTFVHFVVPILFFPSAAAVRIGALAIWRFLRCNLVSYAWARLSLRMWRCDSFYH
jgi:hypothetical protein